MTFKHESVNFLLDILQGKVSLLDMPFQEQIQERLARFLTDVVISALLTSLQSLLDFIPSLSDHLNQFVGSS